MLSCEKANCSDDDVGNDFEMIPMFTVNCDIWEDDDFDDPQIVEGIEVDEDWIDEDPCMQGNELFRTGPRVQNYFNRMLDNLRSQLGLEPNSLCAPIALQRLMERFEMARVPISIWQSFINVSSQVISMSGIKFDKETLIEILIWVLSVLIDFFVQHVLLTTMLIVIHRLSDKHLSTVITFIYHFLKSSAKKLWTYVEKKLEKYCKQSTRNCYRCS